MRLMIAAWTDGLPARHMAREGGEISFRLLDDVARFQTLVKKRHPWPTSNGKFPPAVSTMLRAVQQVDDQDLTPLAAVAGTIAELVADHIFSLGAERVIVDNGGDIAIRMRSHEKVRVGIRLDVTRPEVSHYLEIGGNDQIAGVTTSGLGGRSVTKGVAQAAVVLARTASVADAASTSVANATSIVSPRVQRVLAENMDPVTDLRGDEVVACVETLDHEEAELALAQGARRGGYLCSRGVIMGYVLAVQGRILYNDQVKTHLHAVT